MRQILNFQNFIQEKYVSHAAYALNRLFAKLDPRATKGDQRGRNLDT